MLCQEQIRYKCDKHNVFIGSDIYVLSHRKVNEKIAIDIQYGQKNEGWQFEKEYMCHSGSQCALPITDTLSTDKHIYVHMGSIYVLSDGKTQ